MNTTWIVCANAGRARFYSRVNASGPLEEVHDMVNEAVRLRELENTESDKLGPTAGTKSMHNTGGAVPNKLYQPAQSPQQHAAELFARDVVGFLEQAHREGRFQQLGLVMSPHFLGTLRQLLPAQLQALVSIEIDKDFTQSSAGDLRERLRAN